MEKNEMTEEDWKILEIKEWAITAGLVVSLDPHEADILGAEGFDEVTDEEEYQDLLDSRFDPCEYDLEACAKIMEEKIKELEELKERNRLKALNASKEN